MIFVSYTDSDLEWVEAFVVDLGLLGQNVYFEEKRLGGSERWDEIFASIEQSDAFVYTITATTQVSLSRLLEYEHALALGKPILPLRLEDVDLWALPPGLLAIIDYQPQNEMVRAELARILTAIPPMAQPVPAIARPELAFALGQLYRRIHTADNSPAENAAILLNLKEFLERRETFTAAEPMLNDFADRIATTGTLADEVRRLRTHLRRINRPRSLLSRGRVLKGLFVLALVGGLLWLLRSAPMMPILGDPAAIVEGMTLTPTGITVNLPVELTAEVLAGFAQSTVTDVSTGSYLGDSRASASILPPTQPSATALEPPPQSPPTQPPIHQPPTQSPPTATPLPPTATPLPPKILPPTQPPSQTRPGQPPIHPPTHQPPPIHPRGRASHHGNRNHGNHTGNGKHGRGG